jgi:hypothetical protein
MAKNAFHARRRGDLSRLALAACVLPALLAQCWPMLTPRLSRPLKPMPPRRWTTFWSPRAAATKEPGRARRDQRLFQQADRGHPHLQSARPAVADPSLVVTVTNPRNTSINIRGLGNNVSVYNDGLEPAVGVYQDGVYLARPGQAVFDMADLDHIEVLRGPQGTLFGKNTSAGAVVINTKAPTFKTEAGATSAGAITITRRSMPISAGRWLPISWPRVCLCRRPTAMATPPTFMTAAMGKIITISACAGSCSSRRAITSSCASSATMATSTATPPPAC